MSQLRSLRIFSLVISLSVATACATPISTVPASPAQTNTPLPLPTHTAIPTLEPTLPAPPTETPPPTPAGPGLYLPVGLAIVPAGGGKITYYDLGGQQIGELQAPNLATGLYQQAHIAGSLTGSPNTVLPSLVFYAAENNGELWLNDNGSLSLLKAAPNLFSLVGIPGRPTLAYTIAEYTNAGVRSLIYMGDPQSLPTSDMLLDSTNSQSYAIKLLAISISDGQPAGLWYTTVPYGIGGDIVFEPRSALYYFDLATSSSSISLNLAKSPVGFSDDQAWVAYVANSGTRPMNIMHNFESSSNITFPLRVDSNRGSGDAVFSPNNQYVAWREAGGSYMDQPSTFHETIRIATLDGNILTEIPDTALVAVSGFSAIGSAVPAGWLDTQTLVLEVKDFNGDNTSVLKVGIDGAGLTVFAPGSFIGFLYP